MNILISPGSRISPRFLLTILSVIFCLIQVQGQTDSLIMKNGHVIVGEIKSMTRGVIQVETDYSDSDFKIEWDQVSQLYSNEFFLITLSDGSRLNASMNTDSTNIESMVLGTGSGPIYSTVNDIVYAKPLEGDFISRMSASLSIGYNLTKNNNLHQFSSRVNLGYLANFWSLKASYDAVRSSQDDVPDVKRTNAYIQYSYFLKNDWYLLFNQEFLQNDEQLLALRSNSRAGLGKYLIHTNNSTLGLSAGASWNNERFTDETPNRNSAEGFFTIQLDIFDAGDLSLFTSATAYPSFTEKGRLRADFKTDLKYDLPGDFFISIAFINNYDNKPIEGAAKNDYVFQTSFGWEL